MRLTVPSHHLKEKNQYSGRRTQPAWVVNELDEIYDINKILVKGRKIVTLLNNENIRIKSLSARETLLLRTKKKRRSPHSNEAKNLIRKNRIDSTQINLNYQKQAREDVNNAKIYLH